MQIFGFLGSLLGWILWGAFYVLKDFGLAIIVFTNMPITGKRQTKKCRSFTIKKA